MASIIITKSLDTALSFLHYELESAHTQLNLSFELLTIIFTNHSSKVKLKHCCIILL